jgi:GntR family transcriptional regulator
MGERLMLIDRKSPIPIYAQLKEQIKYAIESSHFDVGDRLPTVRQYAVDLKINLNTVCKVYSELEDEGYISTRQGKGTFVTGIPERQDKDEQRLMIIDELLVNLLIQAYALGFTNGEILDLLAMKLNYL